MFNLQLFSGTKRKFSHDEAPALPAPEFERSKPLLKSFVQYKDRLLLLAAYKIAKSLLQHPSIDKGDFTIVLHPEEGGKTKFIHGALDSKDTVGVRIVRGSHDDKPISIASFRKKHTVSHIQKTLEALGGKPYAPVETMPVSYSEAIASIEPLYKNTPDCDPAKKARLGILLGTAMAERDGRAPLLMQLCNHDTIKFKRMQDIFREIGQIVQKMAKTEQERMASLSISEDHLSVGKLVGAASRWPFSAQQAKLILRRANEQQKSLLGEWAQRYALSAFPKALGVELLEKTCKESMDEVQGLLMLIYSKSEKKGHVYQTTEQFDRIFQAISGIVDSADASMKQMKSWLHDDPCKWMEAACELAEKRKKLLDKFAELEKLAGSFHHELPYRKQMSLSLANMAVNLCSMGKEEVELWTEFASNKQLSSLLKSSKETNAILKSATKFLSDAKKEEEKINELTENVQAVRKKYRLARLSNEQAVLKKIIDLGVISSRAANRLYEVYADTKSHVSYKQRELPSQNIEAYFTRVRLLLMLKNDMPPDKFTLGLDDCLRQNANLFREFESIPGLKEQILRHIDSLLYVDFKGFDLEPDVSSLLQHGFRNQPINVAYWLTEEIVPRSGVATNILNLQFLNRHLKVELRSSLPYDETFAMDSPSIQTGTDFDEGIYGHKVPLSEIIGPLQGNDLAEIYSGLFQIATTSIDEYLSLRKKLAKKDTESAHYISTFASEENFSGTITDRLGGNLPRALDAHTPNSLLQNLKAEYPEFEAEAKEVQDYIRKKAAIRILRHLHANMPYYMQKCAQAIVSQPSSQQSNGASA